MKKVLYLFLLSLPTLSFAQQSPIYTYSTIYPVVVNPAFTGLSNSLEGTMRFRTQWQGVPGSPKSFLFNANTSVAGNKVGVGLSVITDKLGVSNYLYVNALYSYKIEMEDGYFSFGLSSGFVQIQNNYSELEVLQQGDVFDNNEQTTKLSFGAGLAYSTDKLMLALAAPRLLKIEQQIQNFGVNELGRIFTLISAYDLNVNSNLVLRPSLLLRLPDQGKLSYDFKLEGIIKNKIKPGIYTRNLDYLGFSAGIFLSQQYQFSYNYEVPISDAPSQFNAHELILSIRFNLFDYHYFDKWF
jgi:type IX secretion system PorP/SprF family membrane protein